MARILNEVRNAGSSMAARSRSSPAIAAASAVLGHIGLPEDLD